MSTDFQAGFVPIRAETRSSQPVLHTTRWLSSGLANLLKHEIGGRDIVVAIKGLELQNHMSWELHSKQGMVESSSNCNHSLRDRKKTKTTAKGSKQATASTVSLSSCPCKTSTMSRNRSSNKASYSMSLSSSDTFLGASSLIWASIDAIFCNIAILLNCFIQALHCTLPQADTSSFWVKFSFLVSSTTTQSPPDCTSQSLQQTGIYIYIYKCSTQLWVCLWISSLFFLVFSLPPNPVSAVVVCLHPTPKILTLTTTTAHNPPPLFVFFCSSFALTKPKEEEEGEEEILLHLHNRKKRRSNKKTIIRECDDTKLSIITNLGKCFV